VTRKDKPYYICDVTFFFRWRFHHSLLFGEDELVGSADRCVLDWIFFSFLQVTFLVLIFPFHYALSE